MPFKSEAQRKWMYANEPAMAKRWEEDTPKGKKLPPKKVQKVANPAYAEGMRQIRQSNKAGTHDNRPNRERSRNAEIQASIKRSRNDQ